MYGSQQELIKNPILFRFWEYFYNTANKLINFGICWENKWYFKLGYITGKYDLEKQLKPNFNYKFLHFQPAQKNSQSNDRFFSLL